ncbi:transposable element Tcb2 transposase [Trichonephila clavipes]|nr:transposable element Tcb2 transposase [Trichonephila clavipes]
MWCHCLVSIRGTVIAQWHVRDILLPHVLPLMQRLPVAIFQQDNVRPLTTRVSQDCLHTVNAIPWPICFPDLSLIEYIWNHLGWRVGHPTSLNKLEARRLLLGELILLSMSVVSNIDENLTCMDHEESDTKIIHHIGKIDVQVNFVIRCSDTDNAAIILGNMRHLKNYEYRGY